MNPQTFPFLGTLVGLLLVGCGIAYYPGQPGAVTNGFAKLDLEDLELDGLYVYEVTYDNRGGKTNIGAIVTKRYSKAQTYTSNARTNADGTLYRNKVPYEGANVELISLPSINQLIFSPNSTIILLIDYETSLDEQDDKNISEEKLFGPTLDVQPLTRNGYENQRFRWKMIRAGNFGPTGLLSYEVTSIDVGGHVYTPSAPVKVETNILQSALKTNLTLDARKDIARFIQAHFPKGYKGIVKIFIKGMTTPLSLRLGLNTPKTAEASGKSVIIDASQDMIDRVLTRVRMGDFGGGKQRTAHF